MLHREDFAGLQMKELFATMPQTGRVEWIGLRPARREPMQAVAQVEIDVEKGLVGDRQAGPAGSHRMVTLIQAEHLEAVAKILRRDSISPELLRRNIVVSGINLLALQAPDKSLEFEIGGAVLKATGNCHPCSRMEENLGLGGYNATRGHGGITATVISGGTVSIGDEVRLLIVE